MDLNFPLIKLNPLAPPVFLSFNTFRLRNIVNLKRNTFYFLFCIFFHFLNKINIILLHINVYFLILNIIGKKNFKK